LEALHVRHHADTLQIELYELWLSFLVVEVIYSIEADSILNFFALLLLYYLQNPLQIFIIFRYLLENIDKQLSILGHFEKHPVPRLMKLSDVIKICFAALERVVCDFNALVFT